MKLELTADQQAFQEEVRKFAQKELAPKAAYHDKTQEFPVESLKKMAEMGLLGMSVPAEYDGAGVDSVTYAVVILEISKADASCGVIVAVQNSLVALPLYKWGTEEQKQKFLKPLAAGLRIGAYCLTEPNVGSDPGDMETTAVMEGDHYILNGTKTFITSAQKAETFVVFAATDRKAGNKGISCFVVDRETPGLSVGPKEDMLGVRASGTAAVTFENCKIPVGNRLGQEGGGFRIAMEALDCGRIGIAAQAIGIAEAAFEASLQYSRERKQFGQPIGDFQMIQAMLVKMATEIEASRLLLYLAAYKKDKGERYSKESSMAKLFASKMAVENTINAVQIFGGYGYTKDYPVERHMRDSKVTEIYEGTSQIQNLVIAKAIAK
ncbi:MAG: acyl-CoA dehydrogenase [Armatimonadetes bacterium]|nr:acyl-CoA dehydrogenase [Armatimonadota bacterium]